MTKKRRLGLAVVLAIGLCGGSVVWLRQPTEPVYKGKPLHYWLQGADGILSDPALGLTRLKPGEAVIALGTNAIPELLRMLVYRQSPLTTRLLAIAQWLHLHLKIQHDPPGTRNHEAVNGFWYLGDRAAGATPELIHLYDTHPDYFSRLSVVAALGLIGPKAKDAVPVLLRAVTNASFGIRINAVGTLGKIHADPAQVVPALTLCLRDPNPIVQMSAIWSLMQFGKDAKPAVPGLLQFLHNANYNPATAPAPQMFEWAYTEAFDSGPFGPAWSLDSSVPIDEAAAALWKIDPDAAAKAHLKRPE
jgi:HEAT repeat protein